MKKSYAVIFVFVTVLTAGACATGYQRMSLTGGYSDSQVDENTYSIVYRGNGYASQKTILKYLLYRCAEITTNKSYDYFVVVGGDVEEKINQIITPGSYSSSTSINMHSFGSSTSGTASTQGNYEPQKTKEYRKYVVSAVIKIYRGDIPKDNARAFNAKELTQVLEPYIRAK